MIKPAHVRQLLGKIRRHARERDSEKAHRAEKALYLAVLEAIAEGQENPVELAAAALKSRRIEFDRWFA
jgi:hypothetical protein